VVNQPLVTIRAVDHDAGAGTDHLHDTKSKPDDLSCRVGSRITSQRVRSLGCTRLVTMMAGLHEHESTAASW